MIKKKIMGHIEKYIDGINKKNKNCDWQIKKNEDENEVVIIGEEHFHKEKVDGEEWKLQRFIIEEIKPKYIVSERYKELIEEQMKGLKIEGVCFCDGIGDDEEIQGKKIKECLGISERPVIALIGHIHAREKSEIHKYCKNNNINYICIWNKKKVTKEDVFEREKEGERISEEYGFQIK